MIATTTRRVASRIDPRTLPTSQIVAQLLHYDILAMSPSHKNPHTWPRADEAALRAELCRRAGGVR